LSKIAIISDSHDNLTNLKKSVTYLNNIKIDFLFHCGDIVSPFSLRILNELNCDYRAVFGNNDGEWLMLNEISNGRIFKPSYFFEIYGKKFIMFHEGDIVKYIDKSIDYVLFGHSHKVLIDKKETQLIINPGSLAGYLTDKATFVILDTESNNIDIIDIDTI